MRSKVRPFIAQLERAAGFKAASAAALTSFTAFSAVYFIIVLTKAPIFDGQVPPKWEPYNQ